MESKFVIAGLVVIIVILIVIGVVIDYYAHKHQTNNRPVSPPTQVTGVVYDTFTGTLSWDESKGGDVKYIVKITSGAEPLAQYDLDDTKVVLTRDAVWAGRPKKTATIIAKNAYGQSKATTFPINVCPKDRQYLYGSLDGGFYCCANHDDAKRGVCPGEACCASGGFTAGCGDAETCGIYNDRSCPLDKPFMYGSEKNGWFCCDNADSLKTNECSNACCAQPGAVGCKGKPPCDPFTYA